MRVARFLRLFALVIAMTSLSPCRGTAQSTTNGGSQGQPPIEFNDRRHPEFFRHQAFLAQAGKGGVTVEQWGRMPAEEQAQRVAEGEAALGLLHAELISRPSRSSDESALFEAVWGVDSEARQNTTSKMVGQDSSRMVESVEALKKGFDGPQVQASLGKMFDGASASAQAPMIPAQKCDDASAAPRRRTGIRAIDDPDSSGGTVHCDLCPTYCDRIECDTKGCRTVKYICGYHNCRCTDGAGH